MIPRLLGQGAKRRIVTGQDLLVIREGEEGHSAANLSITLSSSPLMSRPLTSGPSPIYPDLLMDEIRISVPKQSKLLWEAIMWNCVLRFIASKSATLSSFSSAILLSSYLAQSLSFFGGGRTRGKGSKNGSSFHMQPIAMEILKVLH